MNSNTQLKKKTLTTAISVALLASGHASLVLAQADSSTADSTMALEQITVTATRRETSIQEIPYNISAISGSDLADANVYDSVEALRYIPGVSMADRGYRNAGVAERIIIRGINVDYGVDGDVPLTAPPTVATYVDNTALYGSMILKDLNRIEVLKGPQGTLYGSGSLAGNVRYIMNKPEIEAFSGKASMGFGMTDGSGGFNFNPDLLMNIPLGDTFAVRFNLGAIKNDGVVDYPNVYVLDANGDPVVTGGDILNALPVYESLKDVDDVDIKYGRVSALWMPNDTFNAQLSYQRQKDDIDGRRQVTRGDNLVNGGQYGKHEFGAIQVEPAERDIAVSALEMEFVFGFATLTSSTSYYTHDGDSISDNSGVYARNGWFSYYGSSPRPMAQAERFYDDSAWTQELRLVSNGDNFVDWTGGLFYTDAKYDLGQNSYLPGYIPYLDAYPYPGCETSGWYCLAPYTTNQDFYYRRDQTYTELAGYGEATINFTDDFHWTIGGRYYDNEVEVDAVVDIPIYPGTPGVSAGSIDDNGFLFKTNFAWDVTESSMIYATFSQGYRHAGTNAVPLTGKYAENPAYLLFEPDKLDNYELGYKGTTESFNYAVDVYYTDWENPQLNTATPNWGFFAVQNGESASTKGFEAELSGLLTDTLSYTFGYTYADAKLTDDVYAPAGNLFGSGVLYPDLIGKDGDRLPGTARNVFNVSLTNNVNLSDNATWNTVLSGYYQSKTLNSIGNLDCLSDLYTARGVCRDSANPAVGEPRYQPTSVYNRNYAEMSGFQIWNISTTYTRDSWSASVYLKNMFNEDGTTGVFPYLRGGSAPGGTQNYDGNNSRDYITQPRTIGVVLSYLW
jgi:outer membrane receptor protein involved in Fe transport